MRKTILTLTIILTLAGTLLVPAQSVLADAAPILVQTNDNNQIIAYSGTGWTHETELTGWIDDDQHVSSTTSDYASFRFYGVSITLVATKSYDQGEADIFIDTVADGTVDLYAATPTLQSQVYSRTDLAIGYHTIKVQVKGTKNASSTGYAVNIDAFRYQDAPLQEPPETNEIECYGAVGVCTQNTTQQITIVGTNIQIANTSVQWKLNTAKTVYAKMTGTNIHLTRGQGFGSGTARLAFAVVGQYGAGGVLIGYSMQTADLGSFWSPMDRYAQVSEMDASYYLATVPAVYQTGLQAQECVNGQSCWGIYGPAWDSFVLTLSTKPFEDQCADQYSILMTAGPYVIDPTIAAPLGPSGSPPDEQTYPTNSGYLYMVRVGGDPWHNGSAADQDDTEYSWDGATWLDLKTENKCVNLSTGYYRITAIVQAESDTIYIRVKDPGGNYADNYMDANETFIYTISTVFLIGENQCDSQFSYDPETDLISSTTVPANQPYVTASDELVPSDWYTIEIASGSWKDGGTGADRYDAQFSFGEVTTGNPGGMNVWHNIAEGGLGVFCSKTDGNYTTVYTQADNSAFLYLRVNDEALTFTGNTGSLVINVYHTTFQMTPAQCELTYTVKDFIGNSEIGAQQENGVIIGISSSVNDQSDFGSFRMEQNAWYMIETKDGPWGWVGGTHSELSYDVEVFWGGDWVPLESWTEGECNVKIDALGHRRVFFKTPESGGATYKFRVADTSVWFNNVGKMSIDMYTAYDGGDPLPNGSCDYIYDVDQPVTPLPQEVPANAEDGLQVANPQMLTADTIYAFVIEGNDYDWHEHVGGDPLYDMQISDDQGETWHDVPAGYGPVLCYMQNGHQLTLFIKYGYNYTIRFRVDSTSFSDNTGSMGINIYPANAGDTIDPWTSCTSGLALHVIDPHEWIDVRAEGGQDIQISDAYLGDQTVLGFVVEIEYGTGPWDDGETTTQHYDADLSSDNGSSWHGMDETNPDLICAKLDLLKRYARAYFAFQDGQKWKIRVADGVTATFTDNGGNLAYTLYSVTDAWTTPPCLVDTNDYDCLPPGVFIDGLDVCTTAIIRPVTPTTIDVPDWLAWLGGWAQYGVHIILQYMAWCPKHTDALLGLINLFKSKDPLALMDELNQILTRIRAELEGHNWGDTTAEATLLTTSGSGGSAADSIMDRLFPSEASNPWNGGPLITMTSWSGDSHYDACVSEYGEIIGNDALTAGTCFVSSAATMVGASFVFQIMLELAAIGFLVHSFFNEAQKLAEFMAGNRSE